MPRFIAVHTEPPMTEADLTGQTKEIFEKMSQLPSGVVYNQIS